MNALNVGVKHSYNSSSSAVDFSGTGLAITPPDTEDHRAHTHRRLGWNNAESGSKGLPDLTASEEGTFVNADANMHANEDEARLTSEADGHRSGSLSVDSERSADFTSRPRGQRTATSLKQTIANAFRRASMRVANVRGHTSYFPVGEDDEDADSGSMLDDIEGTTQPDVGGVGSLALPSTPLRGRALGILGPTNPLRLQLYKLLMHPYTEPTILALILLNAVALVVQASRALVVPSARIPVKFTGYFLEWEDFVIFALFILFTIEALGRICLSGLFLDPEVPVSYLLSLPFAESTHIMSMNPAPNTDAGATLTRTGTLHRGHTLRRVYNRVVEPFSIPLSSHARTPSSAQATTDTFPSTSTLHDRNQSEDPESHTTYLSRAMKSDVPKSDPNTFISLPFRLDIEKARSKIIRNIPYLRQGWGRIDCLAVIGFWVSFGLATAGLERGDRHIGIYRALSVLRTARLMGITNGTTTIMRSLKTARPLLANVLFFIVFAMILFSVIGVQSFRRSLRRSCVLLPTFGENSTRLTQMCGGHINATTLAPSPYLYSDGTPASIAKGFTCPLGQVCQEGDNPFGGVESFDTVYYAALQIVILASASTWTRAMYQIIASEYIFASIFFIFGVLVLNFWLFNLLVAVITNSFSAIRSGTKKSAFGAAPLESVGGKPEEGWSAVTGRHASQSRLKVLWSYTYWFWVLLALVSLAVQATATADTSASRKRMIDMTESIITFAFDVEILVRIAGEFPAWRNFFLHSTNWLDLIIAIGSSVIQIPVIHNSRVYPWLTIFQLARFHRVLLVVPRMKHLMLIGFGNMYGLVSMTLFLMLITFLAALFCIQLIRGDMDETASLNFDHLFGSFLAVYQILSGENWASVLYNATAAELDVGQALVVCTFLCCWLLFSNFIVKQMFIAVINENFDVAKEVKRKLQAHKHSEQHSEPTGAWWSMLNPYLWFRPKSGRVNLEHPSLASVQEVETLIQRDAPPMHHGLGQRRPSSASSISHHLRRISHLLDGFFAGSELSDEIPLLDLHRARSESRQREDDVKHEIDQYFDILVRLDREPSISKNSEDIDIRRTRTTETIRRHPMYDKTFWIFPQTNRLRYLCQKMLAILLAVLGNIVTEAIATPLYRRSYYMQHGPVRGAWFHITEVTFGLVLLVEFLIKTVADGFFFTPNAYIRSIWNVLDFIIMVGILVNVTFTLVFVAGLSRFIRALKAVQALRLMTLSHKMRSTFQDLILFGFVRILDAIVLATLYLIPFSVWGTTLFAGLMNNCNDTGVKGIGDCTNEYVNSIHGNHFGFLVPRAWDSAAPSTTFSFDSFKASFLILFEIVSVGWVDVMSVALSVTGKGQQPQINASEVNAIFFVVYNLLGAVVISNLFVSIIISNFSRRTGSAYVTDAQREWNDLQKLIKRLKPSKRPKVKPSSPFRAWCYDRAIHKHGWWTRTMTLLFVAEIVILMTQGFSAETADDWHNALSLTISLVYVVDVTIRLYGLGWHSFRANGWNLFDILVASGSFTTTLLARFYPNEIHNQFLQKLFLVSMAFKLVQRVASLNQLFKTGIASLPVILNLLGLWLTLFMFFTIMYMEVFGLTKWYSAGNVYQNYQTMGSAFLMLVSASTGEGWNQFMHDYTLAYPRCTQVSYGMYQTDCGSTAWAFSLYITWNLLSTFIFINMFTGVVVHSFSYVFQSTGGVLRSITLRETRAFKKAWARFSDPDTRLLEPPNIVPFLAKLDGVFDARIYPSKNSTASILAACRDKKTGVIRIHRLNKLLNKIDFGAIRRRRAVYMRIYHEANMSCYPDKGITFTKMLILLAHHKLIDDREALEPKELEKREATLKLVENVVMLDKALSCLRMYILRRRFLRIRDRARSAVQGPSIPQTDEMEDMGLGMSPTLTLAGTPALKGIAFPLADHGEESASGSARPVPALQSLTPELVAGERTGSRDNLLDDMIADYLLAIRRYEETGDAPRS